MKTELLTGMSAITWEATVKEAEKSGITLSDEAERIAKFFFSLGHKQGQEAMLDIVGDMYANNPDDLVEILEEEYL